MSHSTLAQYPAWAQSLAHGIRARLANTFVLHGNTHDLVPVPEAAAAEAGAAIGTASPPFVPIVTFLADWIFGQRDVVIEYQRANGAVFVFDETITGFRFANGGAQEYFGVTPDLATFGKGLANGYPVSAVAGRADIMKFMEEVFFSFTFGGEALSLAAAVATMDKLRREPVVARIAEQGRKVQEGTRALVETFGCEEFLTVSGHPAWSFLLMSDSGNLGWMMRVIGQHQQVREVLLVDTQHMPGAPQRHNRVGAIDPA